ncbi:MAG: hypothetical protein KAI61_03055 [Alphaproteobacteria bacterium]|nr:hypothetical protein [Alphaproteobacteria bacterium]MCK5658394.1 hypothetical protein [Alphaproteobacteria bacterium]
MKEKKLETTQIEKDPRYYQNGLSDAEALKKKLPVSTEPSTPQKTEKK